MPQFTDTKGQAWSVNLTVASLKRVATYTDFDLLNLLDDDLKGLAELYDNPIRLVEIVYAICEPAIKDRGLSPEDFGELFAGETLRAAADAVTEATAAFYQNPKQGAVLREMRKKIEAGVNHHLDKLATLTESISDDDIKAAIDRELGGTETETDEATPTLLNSAIEQPATQESATLTQ